MYVSNTDRIVSHQNISLLKLQDLDLSSLNYKIGDLKLGTYDNLITARHDTPLIEILRLFISKGISSVPIVDKNDVVLNVYEKYDVLLLAREGPYYNLDIPVSDALARRPLVNMKIAASLIFFPQICIGFPRDTFLLGG